MGIQTEGHVGPVFGNDGSDLIMRQGKTGETIIGQLNPRYYEQSGRGNMYSAANQAAQAVSVALATTYTGLCLYNPLLSGKLLVPTKIKFALSVAPAAIATIGLIQGYSATGGVTAQTTPLTAANNYIGGAAGVARPLSAATIVTPTWLMQIADGFTAAALPAPNLHTDLDGLFVIPPGGFIAIGALTAITGLGSISWAEVQL